ncbi:MAG TPA: type II toxin-antitoxin system VapC family toxin [Longimicrobiales bacterium]|nr:type II toxin-antitoxin system VapC family toxin [Longimicrobiales bacterium]
MAKFVLDTNVLIHAMRNEAARDELAAWQRRMGPHLYMHAVVVAELLVGAGSEVTFERWRGHWLAPAERLGRVIAPTQGTWLRAARTVARLHGEGHLPRDQVRPGFFNDCLLAASAVEQGFILVTHHLADFHLIRRVLPGLRFESPLPS